MSMDGPELLGLALALEAEDTGEEQAVNALVEGAGCSATALMGAYAYALSLARDMPYDTSNELTLGLLTKALQRAVRLSGEHETPETHSLLQQIIDVSGRASVAPPAVASRTAEVEAGVDHLRASADEDGGGEPSEDEASTP